MWYETEIAIPAGTQANDPVEAKLKLSHGVIHHVIIEAAPGCHRAASIRVYYQEHQVYPSNPEEDISLDSVPRTFEDRLEVFSPPYELKIRGYAPDALYDHTYRIGVGVLPPESLPEYSETPSLLKRLFDRLIRVR